MTQRVKEVRRKVHSLRLKDAIREKLIAAAKQNERSLSEELEARVDASFDSARLDRIERLLALFVPQHLANLPVHPIAPFGWTWDEYVARLTSSPGAVVGHINPPGHAANTLDGARDLSIYHVNRRVA